MLVGENEGNRQLLDLEIDDRIITKWTFNNRLGGCGTDSPWPRR
jgi:hypothetical protein